MKLPRFSFVNLNLISQSIKRIKKFSFIKMTELKRSLEIEGKEEQTERPVKKIKFKNRKFALLLCYSGHGYYGLQR